MTLRYWTGSPFGPDTIAGAFSAGFSSNGAFKTYDKYYAGLTFIFSARGERSEYTIFDVDNSIDDTYRPTNKVYDVTVPPTGTPVFGYTIQLTGEYYPTKYLSLSLRPGYRIHVNAYHIEGRIEHGFEMSFSLRFRPPVL
ncbi:MAG: hypothetical protein FWH35_06300, partial [Treponema sp.]|nr:hypothetical protein [Treponema sp.]